ncbi:unnamed protein product [Soboliphyme baturini]|uniref:Ion_trans_2 domain-containing protein n=1 Tax=Soboliphyme baturini TaxID=241478 RepID=A0A183IUB9_9BILA|nr:unnamed protein product [Soboliphyme baturini]
MLYRNMQLQKFRLVKKLWKICPLLRRFGITVEDPSAEVVSLGYEDLILDERGIPVFLVLSIMLMYIAFGAVLFSVLENWGFIDSFYFSFISLTTVGFGDLIPQN